jgi:SAM-dependent methyltransferase
MTVKPLSENAWKALACPACGGVLQRIPEGGHCPACGLTYRFASSGGLDLRLQGPKRVTHEFILGEPLEAPAGVDFGELTENRAPRVDLAGVDVPFHLTRALMSHFPKAQSASELALDLGCGASPHRAVCEAAGFDYVGLDHASEQAQVLGDAHALPFRDSSFGFVLSIAVLEHIRHPAVMMREAARVLRPGGSFIGTVAFLEPFHSESYYHHTHLGTLSSLLAGGFEVQCIAPSADWSGLAAQGTMGLFPRMPGLLVRALLAPLHLLHRAWWKAGGLVSHEATEALRLRSTTGAFSFVARRPADAP